MTIFLVDEWKRGVFAPMRDLLFKYDDEVKQRIKQRNIDKIDYDSYRRRQTKSEVNKSNKKEKNDKIERQKEKLNRSEEAYHSNHRYDDI